VTEQGPPGAHAFCQLKKRDTSTSVAPSNAITSARLSEMTGRCRVVAVASTRRPTAQPIAIHASYGQCLCVPKTLNPPTARTTMTADEATRASGGLVPSQNVRPKLAMVSMIAVP
jgi:hypothetical protein